MTIVHNDDELSFAACREARAGHTTYKQPLFDFLKFLFVFKFSACQEGGAGHTTCDWSSGEATQFTFFRFDTFDTSA